MNKFQGFLAAAAAALAMTSTAAHADTTWSFAYTGANGVHASGTFETAGDGTTPTAIEWITGTYSDQFVTNGTISLIPVTSTPYGGEAGEFLSADGAYYYNNMFNSATGFDDGGLLFSAGGQEVNLYGSNGGFINLDSGVQTSVSFMAAPVPEPGPTAMLLAGLGALAFASRRKRS